MAAPRVQLGFTRPVTEIKEYLDWVEAAEEVGADVIGLGDGQDLWLELYTTLALTAGKTKRARLGPTVTNPLTRHPAVTASAIATLISTRRAGRSWASPRGFRRCGISG